jgi:hypothetical protein
MIIVGVKNGLGNQMFQFAFGKVLEWKYGINVYYDIMNDAFVSGFRTDMDVFEIGDYSTVDKELVEVFKPFSIAKYRIERKYLSYTYYKLRRIVHPSKLVLESLPSKYCELFEKFNFQKDYYFMGHWMNMRYFDGYENRIKALFQLKDKDFYQTGEAREMLDSDYDTVSVHIRRGDYLSSEFMEKIEMDYYNKALEVIRTKVPNPFLYIFTNDPDWVRDEFNYQIPYVLVSGNKGSDSYKDMMLMSLCKHNIIANSSFSWWGAFLNKNKDAIIISPAKWYSAIEKNTHVHNMIPEKWTRL